MDISRLATIKGLKTMQSRSISIDLCLNDRLVFPKFNERIIGSPRIGEVKIAVEYTSINYRDFLAYQANRGVARKFPYTPGVDLVGRILESGTLGYEVGAPVALFALADGECYPGGWSTICSVRTDRLIMLDDRWSLKSVAAVGTAGLAAASAVDFVSRNGSKSSSEIKLCAVTGATGGVGVLSCILAKMAGFEVMAVVRNLSKASASKLYDLGVAKIIDLEHLLEGVQMSLAKQEFDVAIDTLGGTVATALAKKLKIGGALGVCGLVTSQEIPGLNLLPFLLRGISMSGSGAEVIYGDRMQRALELLENLYISEEIKSVYTVVPFDKVPSILSSYNELKPFGRIVIEVR